LDLSKSSVSDMCPIPFQSGRIFAHQRSWGEVGKEWRLPKMAGF
jgi:hypothetical protein